MAKALETLLSSQTQRDKFIAAVKAGGGKVSVIAHAYFTKVTPEYEGDLRQFVRNADHPIIFLDIVEELGKLMKKFGIKTSILRKHTVPKGLHRPNLLRVGAPSTCFSKTQG
jgi:hypothetical protein